MIRAARPFGLQARRVLRPGGRFLCLEFSHMTNPVLSKLYERYSFEVIPRIGGLVAGDRASYQCVYHTKISASHPVATEIKLSLATEPPTSASAKK